MKTIIVFLFIGKALLTSFAGPALAVEPCSFNAESVTLPNAYGELWLEWDLVPETPSLYEPVTQPDGMLARLQAWVSSNTDTDPIYLLKRQRALYEKYHFNDELPVFDLAISGRLGTIRPINCLQALLLEAHLVNRPGFRNSIEEFGAYILRKRPDPRDPARGYLKIYFQSGPEAGVPPRQELKDRVAADLQSGWALAYHIHNHPFGFDNPAGDIAGTLIPSGGDRPWNLNTRKQYGLEEAWITNGFHTIAIPASQFQLGSR